MYTSAGADCNSLEPWTNQVNTTFVLIVYENHYMGSRASSVVEGVYVCPDHPGKSLLR